MHAHVQIRQLAPGTAAAHTTHAYTGVTSALRSIYAQGGIAGLFASSSINMLRSAIGTPVNLTAYTCVHVTWMWRVVLIA